MCHIQPFYPWGGDWELDQLRRRVADLERREEKQRLLRRIEELERKQGGRQTFPLPTPPAPKPRRVEDILPLIGKAGR